MTHKLLLADDSITIQRVIELTFSGEDIEVISVGDGDAAVERFESERPDIVLADISMPKRSGYDVATYVRSHSSVTHLPVLLLAGAFETVDQARADQVGCDGVLVKPFEPQQVVARVRELLARADADRRRASPPASSGPVAAVIEGRPPSAVVGESPAPTMSRRAEEPVAVPSHPAPGLESVRTGAPVAPVVETPSMPASEPAGAQWFMSETSADVPAALAAALDETELPFTSEAPVAVPVEPPRVTPPAPVPPAMAPAVAPAPMGDVLEDYFGRIGPAVEAFGAAGRVAPVTTNSGTAFDDPWTYGEVPTVSGLLNPSLPAWPGASRLADGGVTDRTSSSRDAFAPDELADAGPEDGPESSRAASFIADAFHALLESEQGRPGAADPRPPVVAPTVVGALDVSDELVERVTQRVIERLVPHAARDMVAGIVSDVAERLVREEMARARTRAEGRQ